LFAPEGLWYIAVPAVLFFSFALLGVAVKKSGWFIPSGILLVFWLAMLFFFRDPVRPLPEQSAIVSPTDGTVLKIEENRQGYTTIKIYLSPMNVHAVRAPLKAEVFDSEFLPGEFLRADHPEAGDRNQQVRAILLTEYGRATLRVVAGVLVRRVIVPLDAGQMVVPGERIGFVRFGSRCEITLPSPFRPIVRAGDPVIGGVTRLGHWENATGGRGE
jgi:phosphatidylserine decarboxylase